MPDRHWVAAAPFRAHLNHVSAVTSTPWQVLALHAQLPVGLVRDLLDVRPGRRVHRIAPELAEQVWSITPEAVLELRHAVVPARSARLTLRRLVAAGWTCHSLARRLHVPLGQLDALVNGLLPEVPALLDLRLAALLATGEPSPALRLRRAQPAA